MNTAGQFSGNYAGSRRRKVKSDKATKTDAPKTKKDRPMPDFMKSKPAKPAKAKRSRRRMPEPASDQSFGVR